MLPAKPTIQQDRPLEMIEMTKEELAAADVRNLPKAGSGAGGAGIRKQSVTARMAKSSTQRNGRVIRPMPSWADICPPTRRTATD